VEAAIACACRRASAVPRFWSSSRSLGRFISEDPARDGANWFEYCRSNPVNAVDPDGKEWTQRQWDWYVSFLHSMGTNLLTGGVMAVAAGVAAWYGALPWSKGSKTGAAGKLVAALTIKGGAVAVVAGALLLYASWYLNGITDPDEMSDAAALGVGFVDNAVEVLEGGW